MYPYTAIHDYIIDLEYNIYIVVAPIIVYDMISTLKLSIEEGCPSVL